MAFPSIAGTPATTALTSANPGTVVMPGSIIAGEVLVCVATGDTTGAMSQSGGTDWDLLEMQGNVAGAATSAIFAKVAEGSDTLSIQFEANDFSAICFRVTDHGVTHPLYHILRAGATGTSETPDPPELDTGIYQEWLWIEAFSADDDDDTTDYETSGWTKIAQVESASSTSSCLTAAAYLQSETDILNPGAMALAAEGGEQWGTWTIAIPPVGGAPPLPLDNLTISNQNGLSFDFSFDADGSYIDHAWVNLVAGSSPGTSESGLAYDTSANLEPHTYEGKLSHRGVLDDGACTLDGTFVVDDPGQYTISVEAYDAEEPANLLFSDSITLTLSGGLRWVTVPETAYMGQGSPGVTGLKAFVYVAPLGLYITGRATGTYAENETIMWSTDKETWTFATCPDVNIRSFAYKTISETEALIVGVGDGGDDGRIVTSTDGKNWTVQTVSGGFRTWQWVIHIDEYDDDGRFVAVCDDGTSNQAMTSPDGETWTIRTTPAGGYSGAFQTLAYHPGNDFVMAAGRSYDADHCVMTSDDGGVTWSWVTVPQAAEWRDMAYGDGVLFVVSRSLDGATANTHGGMYTANGADFTLVNMPEQSTWEGVMFSDLYALWIAVSRNATAASGTCICGAAYSYDYQTWYPSLTPDEEELQEIIYSSGEDIFVAIGEGQSPDWNIIYSYPRILSVLTTAETETGADHTIQYTGPITAKLYFGAVTAADIVTYGAPTATQLRDEALTSSDYGGTIIDPQDQAVSAEGEQAFSIAADAGTYQTFVTSSTDDDDPLTEVVESAEWSPVSATFIPIASYHYNFHLRSH